jgi:hypothetical protein
MRYGLLILLSLFSTNLISQVPTRLDELRSAINELARVISAKRVERRPEKPSEISDAEKREKISKKKTELKQILSETPAVPVTSETQRKLLELFAPLAPDEVEQLIEFVKGQGFLLPGKLREFIEKQKEEKEAAEKAAAPEAGGPPPPGGAPEEGGPPPPGGAGGPPVPGGPSGIKIKKATEEDKQKSDVAVVKLIKALGAPRAGTLSDLTAELEGQISNLTAENSAVQSSKKPKAAEVAQGLKEEITRWLTPPGNPIDYLRQQRDLLQSGDKEQQKFLSKFKPLLYDASVLQDPDVLKATTNILINLLAAWRTDSKIPNPEKATFQEQEDSDAEFMKIFETPNIQQWLFDLNWLRISPTYLKYETLQEDVRLQQKPLESVAAGAKPHLRVAEAAEEQLARIKKGTRVKGIGAYINQLTLTKKELENVSYMGNYLFSPYSLSQDQINAVSSAIETAKTQRAEEARKKTEEKKKKEERVRPAKVDIALQWGQDGQQWFSDFVNQAAATIDTPEKLVEFITKFIKAAAEKNNRGELTDAFGANEAAIKFPSGWVRFKNITQVTLLDELKKVNLKLINSSIIAQFLAFVFQVGPANVPTKVQNNWDQLGLRALQDEAKWEEIGKDLAGMRSVDALVGYILTSRQGELAEILTALYSINRSPESVGAAVQKTLDEYMAYDERAIDAASKVVKQILPPTFASVVHILNYYVSEIQTDPSKTSEIILDLKKGLNALNTNNSTSDRSLNAKIGAQLGEDMRGKLDSLVAALTANNLRLFLTELRTQVVENSGLPKNNPYWNNLENEYALFASNRGGILAKSFIKLILAQLEELTTKSPQSVSPDTQIEGLRFVRGMEATRAREFTAIYKDFVPLLQPIVVQLQELVLQDPFVWRQQQVDIMTNLLDNVRNTINSKAGWDAATKTALLNYVQGLQNKLQNLTL